MFFGGNCGCGYTQVESYPACGGGIGNFALIVVLFILLIIVGAAYYC
ncbi:YjcZ family sporulation protein [Aciduricibacillus chroicocephali]|uniref:YjcZ family sporulation protein n=1 Tax=Aciduricibacillus chroicocephali TaxID=3054939 RepID=A0ABY9KXU3_9BACI|nr:YjcZ family sporulation protein [Bacillaceae bacterium 44XB]